jgi:P-type Cu2+ transporter
MEKTQVSGNKDIQQQTFPVLEMTCGACAVSVESILKATPGVKNASVNFANQTALVEFDKGTQPLELQNAVRSIGYDLIIQTEDPGKAHEDAQRQTYQALKKRTALALAFTIPVVIIGMFFMDMPYASYISLILTAPVVFYFGRNFFIHAWKQASYGRANMDTLVALSTGIAFLFSAFNTFFPEYWHTRGLHAHVYFEAAAVVIVFISLGKLLEEKAKATTSSAIRKLMDLQPKIVTVVIDGVEKQIPASQVKKGDTVIVKPGDKIPVDGIVVAGTSFVDESMISGEPVAVEKSAGQKVFAGTLNQKGSFRFAAEKIGSETVLGQIIKMVQQAQGSKAPVQKLVDKIAGIFVPIVIGIAVVTFSLWMVFGGQDGFTHGLLTAVTVLVIACPCALGLATPTAIMVGVGKGAENNILIKDAESLEIAHKVNAIILDKTGTITEGKPVVTDLEWTTNNEISQRNKEILLSLESRSEHPLADAISSRLKGEGITHVAINNFESITGRGIRGTVDGTVYAVGNRKLLEELKIEISPQASALSSRLQAEAKTVFHFASQHGVLAVIGVADKIKGTSRKAIEELQRRSIEVYMLTGDNEQTAKAVASQVGVRNYRSEVLPSDKAAFVKQLQAANKIVAMVGDGINDSQALAEADISIAMGRGSDIAMDTAKMTLITSDLSVIPRALKLSSMTVNGIRQNLFWAFIYNMIGIPLAAGVLYPVNGFLLNPMIAGAAMALSSLSVVANSLRLKARKI